MEHNYLRIYSLKLSHEYHYHQNHLQQGNTVDLIDPSSKSRDSLTYVLRDNDQIEAPEPNKTPFELNLSHFRGFDGANKDRGEKDYLEADSNLSSTDNINFLSALARRIDNDRLNIMNNGLELCDNFFD